MTDQKKGDDPKNSPKGEKKGEPSGGTNPAKDGKKEGATDPSKLSDEQLTKVLEDPRIWKTERLAQLRAESKELKELRKKQDTAEKKKLEKEGKYKELLGKTQKELEQANASISKLEMRNKIANAAVAKGIKDVDAAVKLIDTSKVTKGEDGEYSGLTEAVESLVKDRPYLVNSQQSVGSPSNPGQGEGGVKRYTVSQIQDPEFYQEHRDDIIKAQREGRIAEDRQVMTPAAPTAT